MRECHLLSRCDQSVLCYDTAGSKDNTASLINEIVWSTGRWYWQWTEDAEKSLSQCHFVHPKYHTAYLGGTDPEPNILLYYIYYFIFIIDLVAWYKSLKRIFYQSKVTITKQVERRKSVYFTSVCATRKERILTLTLSKGIIKLLMRKFVLHTPFGIKGVSYNKKWMETVRPVGVDLVSPKWGADMLNRKRWSD